MTSADGAGELTEPATAAARMFGARVGLAERYVDLLTREGVRRGLIGPREVDRLWDRHVLNSAAIAELIPPDATVVDVGSGAGLPGIPLAIARPDLTLTLLEPMARRIEWLDEVVGTLGLSVTVLRGRAEERSVRNSAGGADVVTARAVAPLAKLASWCLPLLDMGGRLLALKGATVTDELARDRAAVTALGGGDLSVVSCGASVLAVPTTVVVVRRIAAPARGTTGGRPARGRDGGRRTGKDR